MVGFCYSWTEWGCSFIFTHQTRAVLIVIVLLHFWQRKEREKNFSFTLSQSYTGVWNVLASFMALVVLQCLLSHQIPEQHAEHCVGSQTEEDWTHAFIQPQHTFGLAHFQHTIWKSMVQTPLKQRQMVLYALSVSVYMTLFCYHSIQVGICYKNKTKKLTLWESSTGWLYSRVLMTSKGVMVMATATPLIMAATKAVSQLFGLSHWTETHWSFTKELTLVRQCDHDSTFTCATDMPAVSSHVPVNVTPSPWPR